MEEDSWNNFAWATGALVAPFTLTATYVVACRLAIGILPEFLNTVAAVVIVGIGVACLWQLRWPAIARVALTCVYIPLQLAVMFYAAMLTFGIFFDEWL